MDLKNLVKPSKETVLQAVLKSSFLNILARGFGYLKQVSIAVSIGFSLDTDAFFLALGLLGLFLTFTDVFDSLGVPNLVRARQRSFEEFQNLAGVLLTFTTALAVIVTFLAFILSPIVIKIAFGYSESERELLNEYFLFLLPYLFFSFFFHHFGAIHRSLRHFTVYFFGELLFSFLTCLFTTLGLLFTKNPKVLPIALDISQFIATGYMILVSRPYWEIKFYIDRTVKSMLKQFLQLLGVYSVFHLSMLIDKAFASYLPPKSVSALSYGWMVAMIPKGVFRLENIVITSLSEVNGSKEKVDFYVKRIFLLSLPFVGFIFFLAPQLVKLLFGYGAFSVLDVELTAEATRFYSLSLPFVFLWTVFYRIFQIKDKILLIIPVVVLSMIIKVFLDYIVIFKTTFGIMGLSLVTSVTYFTLYQLSYLFFVYNLQRR